MAEADLTHVSEQEAAEAGDFSPPKAPYPKVQAAGIGGAIATLVVGILALLGVEVPETVAAAGATVLAFALSYLRKE